MLQTFNCASRTAVMLSLSLAFSYAIAEEPYLTISAGGDTLLANAPSQSIPVNNMLAPIAHIMNNTDFTFLNYEGTLCDLNLKSHKCTNVKPGQLCYAFRSPTKFANDLAEVGVDIVNIANNHIFDYGHACANQTKESLEAAGIIPFGLMNKHEPLPDHTVVFVPHKGEKILFLGFHYSDAWNRLISINDVNTVRDLIRKYRDQAKLIVVSFHAGAEGAAYTKTPQGAEIYKGENRGNSRQFARIAIDEGADLVLGHGPHVLRGMEIYNNRLIVYSLGNFATFDLFNLKVPNNIGALVDVALNAEGEFISGKINSLRQGWLVESNHRQGAYVEIDNTMGALNLFKKLSEQDFTNSPKFENDGIFYP